MKLSDIHPNPDNPRIIRDEKFQKLKRSIEEFPKMMALRPNRNAEHPTMKPVSLFAYQMSNSSKEGDVVLDPLGGSGTTMVASHQMWRRAHLIELDPKYCAVIIDRMITLDPSLQIKRNGEVYESTKLS